ncbi:MAG TPA: histone deacetylase [Actinobacteria bacterium]|nr:histone deacetylase [Actinomycetota bacterium]
MKGSSTTLIYHSLYLEHDPGLGHPERPARLTAICDLLEDHGIFSRVDLVSPDEAPTELISAVHDPGYVRAVAEMAARGGGYLDVDTGLSGASFRAARLAVGGVVLAVEKALSQERGAFFCLVRPPGHHATSNRGMGFCLFNNLAIGTRYALDVCGAKKVFILDWDAHHGNGIQDIFYDTPAVLYLSLHQYPLYPGTGYLDEVGVDSGEGFTVNIPLPAGAGDDIYLKAFDEIVSPLVGQFEPDLIMVAAGYDGHFADPLAGLNLTVRGYAEMTKRVRRLAHDFCGNRLIFSLEGGYDLGALSRSVLATISELASLGLEVEDPRKPPPGLPIDESRRILNSIKTTQRRYWKL